MGSFDDSNTTAVKINGIDRTDRLISSSLRWTEYEGRALPYSKTRHGLYLDIVRNRGAVQLHGEAQIWHICL